MTTIYLVQGDSGSQIKATLTRDDSGAAINLTDATVKLKFKKKNTTTVLSTLTSIVSSSDDLLAGSAVFEFNSSDLDISPGAYVAEIFIEFDSGDIETVYEELDIQVREDY